MVNFANKYRLSLSFSMARTIQTNQSSIILNQPPINAPALWNIWTRRLRQLNTYFCQVILRGYVPKGSDAFEHCLLYVTVLIMIISEMQINTNTAQSRWHTQWFWGILPNNLRVCVTERRWNYRSHLFFIAHTIAEFGATAPTTLQIKSNASSSQTCKWKRKC